MANEKNLIPFTSEQSREEAKKNGAKGGVASGIARRRKKQAKDYAKLLLSQPISDKNKALIQERFGEIDDDFDNNMLLLMIKVYEKAQKGDLKAFEKILELIGEKPMSSHEKAKLKLERDKFKLEKEKFEWQKQHENGSSEYDDGVEIVW